MRPYYERGGVVLYHGDWRGLLAVVPGDVVVTDPPYGTGGWRRTAAGAGSDPKGSLVREEWDDGSLSWLERSAAALAVVTFFPSAHTGLLLAEADRIGLDKHRAVYMHKSDPKPLPSDRTRWSVEPVWVLSREGFVLHGGTDLLTVSTPRLGRDAGATGHPYEKPLEFMRWLVAKIPAEARVVEPFSGSGTTLVAAASLGRSAWGCEQDERWCEVAARRLDALFDGVRPDERAQGQAALFGEAS